MATGLLTIVVSGIQASVNNQPVWVVLGVTTGGSTTYTLLGSTTPTSDSLLITEGIVRNQFGFETTIPAPTFFQTYSFQVFTGGNLSTADIATFKLTNSTGTVISMFDPL